MTFPIATAKFVSVVFDKKIISKNLINDKNFKVYLPMLLNMGKKVYIRADKVDDYYNKIFEIFAISNNSNFKSIDDYQLKFLDKGNTLYLTDSLENQFNFENAYFIDTYEEIKVSNISNDDKNLKKIDLKIKDSNNLIVFLPFSIRLYEEIRLKFAFEKYNLNSSNIYIFDPSNNKSLKSVVGFNQKVNSVTLFSYFINDALSATFNTIKNKLFKTSSNVIANLYLIVENIDSQELGYLDGLMQLVENNKITINLITNNPLKTNLSIPHEIYDVRDQKEFENLKNHLLSVITYPKEKNGK